MDSYCKQLTHKVKRVKIFLFLGRLFLQNYLHHCFFIHNYCLQMFFQQMKIKRYLNDGDGGGGGANSVMPVPLDDYAQTH